MKPTRSTRPQPPRPPRDAGPGLVGVILALLVLLAYCARAEEPPDLYAGIADGYHAALVKRDHGDIVGASTDVTALLSDTVALALETNDPIAHAWLAILHERQGALLTYFGDSWAARCTDPTFIHPGDAEALQRCLAWARCGRQWDAVVQFHLSLAACTSAGLRPSEFPCAQAHGLQERAASKLLRCARQIGQAI